MAFLLLKVGFSYPFWIEDRRVSREEVGGSGRFDDPRDPAIAFVSLSQARKIARASASFLPSRDALAKAFKSLGDGSTFDTGVGAEWVSYEGYSSYQGRRFGYSMPPYEKANDAIPRNRCAFRRFRTIRTVLKAVKRKHGELHRLVDDSVFRPGAMLHLNSEPIEVYADWLQEQDDPAGEQLVLWLKALREPDWALSVARGESSSFGGLFSSGGRR